MLGRSKRSRSTANLNGNFTAPGEGEEIYVALGVRLKGEDVVRFLHPQKVMGGLPSLGSYGLREFALNVEIAITEETDA